MAFFRLNKTFQNESTLWSTLYEYTNNAKRNLFINRFDLILTPLAAKYLLFRIRHNGITIYEQNEPAERPFLQFPIRNLITSIPRDDTITIETASSSGQTPTFPVTISAEFDFVDAPYPAALIPLTNADLLGITESINIFDSAPFDQSFDDSHYAPVDLTGYSKMLLLISTNEQYNPSIISNQTFPIGTRFFDLFTGSYRGNKSGIEKRGAVLEDDTTNRLQAVYWWLGDGDTFQTTTLNLDSAPLQPGTLARSALVNFDLDESGQYVIFPRVFNGNISFFVYDLQMPFVLSQVPVRETPRTPYTGYALQTNCVKMIDASNVILGVRKTQAGAITWEILVINAHLETPGSPIEILQEIDITSALPEIYNNDGQVQGDSLYSINVSADGKTMAFAYRDAASRRKIHTATITTQIPYDFSNFALGDSATYENPSSDILFATCDPAGRRGFLFFNAMTPALYSTEDLTIPYIMPPGMTITGNNIPIANFKRLQFRFDSAEMFINWNTPGNTVMLEKRAFEVRSPGWTLRDRNNVPFLPFFYRGRYTADQIDVDLNNPDNENRMYQLQVTDNTSPQFDWEYTFTKEITFRGNQTAWRNRRYHNTWTFVFRRKGVRVYSENIQTLDIYAFNEREIPQLITSIPNFSGTQAVQVTTDKTQLQIRKRIAFNFKFDTINRTETKHFEVRNYLPNDMSRTTPPEVQSLFDIINAFPTNGITTDPYRDLGYSDGTTFPEFAAYLRGFLNVKSVTETARGSMSVDTLARLPLPVTRITISVEALTPEGEYRTIIPDIGTISPVGETAITLSEAFEGRVLPKGRDLLRFKVTTDGQTTLTMDAILSN